MSWRESSQRTSSLVCADCKARINSGFGMEFDDKDIGGGGEHGVKSLDQSLGYQVLQGLAGGLR